MVFFKTRCRSCGVTLSKKERVCKKCGQDTRVSGRKCPYCGFWVAVESNLCPECNHSICPQERLNLNRRRWFAEPGKFAQKLEIGRVERLRKRGLVIEAGTRVVFLRAGQIKGWLDSGEYAAEDILRRISDFRKHPPSAGVLIHSGEMALPFEIGDLYAHEEDEVQAQCVLVIRAREDEDGARRIIENMVKERGWATYNDVAELLKERVRDVLRRYVARESILDLFLDPDVDEDFEIEAKAKLSRTLRRYGLEFVEVASVDFDSPCYEHLRKDRAELENECREVQFAKALVKVQMEKFKTEKELREYILQLWQEYMLGGMERERERQEAQEKLGFYTEQLVRVHGGEAEGTEVADMLRERIARTRQELKQARAEAAEEIVRVCEEMRPRERPFCGPLKIEECDDTPDNIAATLSVTGKEEDAYRYHLFHKPVVSFGRKWFEGKEPVNDVVIRNYQLDEEGMIVEPDPSWPEGRKREFKQKMDDANLMVSRRHFCLEEKEGSLFVRDSSKYGTAIDGQSVARSHPYELIKARAGKAEIVCGGKLCLQAEVKSRQDEPRLSWLSLSWARRGTRYRCVRLWQPEYSARQEYLIIGTQILIGSGADCDIRLEGSGIPELHSRIFRAYGELWLEPLAEELSGTLDGKELPAHKPVRLEHGMEIGVGDYRLCFDQYRPIIVDYDSVSA